MKQALTDVRLRADNKSQTTQSEVAKDGSDTYGNTENEQRECFWRVHIHRLLNPQSHRSLLQSTCSAPRARNRTTRPSAEASLKLEPYIPEATHSPHRAELGTFCRMTTTFRQSRKSLYTSQLRRLKWYRIPASAFGTHVPGAALLADAHHLHRHRSRLPQTPVLTLCNPR